MKNQSATTTTTGESGKLCSVCGDKALGYNFNAVTCESCKAFFRRNALSNKEFTCPFSDDCKVTIITRRFCQKCRLQKCFEIGMKKEYIMSEEDKVMKRKKIEQNRAKKRISVNNINNISKIPIKIKCEETSIDNDELWLNEQTTTTDKHKLTITKNVPSSSPPNIDHTQNYGSPTLHHNDLNSENEILYSPTTTVATSPTITINNNNKMLEKEITSPKESYISSTTNGYIDNNNQLLNDTKQIDDVQFLTSDESRPSDIVNCILNSKFGSKNMIDRLMKTPNDAVLIMSKIINSPKDAIILIEHLVSTPGDALHIISKIMNSPLDALTVFTQFMSSPTDALQIIQKIVNSPKDILQFMQQLMNSPEDALQIMNKYMNSPTEALKIINKMMNNNDEQLITNNHNYEQNEKLLKDKNTSSWDSGFSMIKLMLGNLQADNSIQQIPSSNKINHQTMPNQFCDNISSNSNILFNQNGTNNQTIHQTSVQQTVQTTEEIITNIIEDIKQEPVKSNSFEAMLCEAIRIEYESYHEEKDDEQISRKLNTIEFAKLRELITANEALYAPVDDFELDSDECRLPSNSNQANPELLRVINLTAVAVRRLIKMAKKINAFKNMCQEDQLALLKGGCIEMMILRSVMQYDEDQHTWKIPHRKAAAMANIKADVLKLAKGNIYEKHERFISNFDKKWRSDMNIIPIMCAITLFSPDRPRTVHSDVIKLEQTSYYCLLRRYLESIYPGCEAKSTFLKLIQKIHDLQKLNEEVINVYLDVNPAQIEPLLIEIFDLKTK